jgi:hypothetical protein
MAILRLLAKLTHVDAPAKVEQDPALIQDTDGRSPPCVSVGVSPRYQIKERLGAILVCNHMAVLSEMWDLLPDKKIKWNIF